ncbi:MAG: HAMP domain-containing sensor histidine kinase [Syntrophomonadaceae bacterium]|nr:HAMP domain-containing sensor histidine kinase [Syntrophomonadaceae bacterium]
MKSEFSRKLKIKLIGASILRIAAIILAYFIIGILIYNTGIEEMLTDLLHGILGSSYSNVSQIVRALIPFVLMGVIIYLAYQPVIKAINYLQKIVDSVDILFQRDDAYIQLPEDLQSVGEQLNSLKHTTIKNEQIATQAEKQKNDLVVYLAHDIKTPLTSIIGYLNLLDEAPDMPLEQRAKYVGVTLEKVYRLEELINEFFEITRFNLQSIVLNKREINLSFMLQQLADEFYPMLAPQGKQIVVNAPDDLVLWADADKLSRVFNNILKNANVYSYENSIINIFAFKQEENVTITFSNKGKTIPPEKLETIFEKFFRLDVSRSSNTGGAGLGLAISKEIVAAHGGTITAQSSDEQTVFTITLPNESVAISSDEKQV